MILSSDETPDVDDTVLRTQKTDYSIQDQKIKIDKVDEEDAMDNEEKIEIKKLLERYG